MRKFGVVITLIAMLVCAFSLSATAADENCVHANTIDVSRSDSTCTTDGIDAGEMCMDCGAIIRGCAVIPKGHKATRVIPGKLATCDEDGYSQGIYCDACKSYISGNEVLKATGHFDADNDYKCNNCGKDMPDGSLWGVLRSFFNRLINFFLQLFSF